MPGLKMALVLFDVDGCTSVINTRRLRCEVALTKSCYAIYPVNGKELTVEILELSDSRPLLDKFEEEWSSTHRSITLDKEKRRRTGKDDNGGYLAVWPSEEDTEDACIVVGHEEDEEEEEVNNIESEESDDEIPPPIKRQRKQRLRKAASQEITEEETLPKAVADSKSDESDTEIPQPARPQPRREMTRVDRQRTELVSQRQQRKNTKKGSNGRSIQVHTEGFGDFTGDVVVPTRDPLFSEHLTPVQSDLVEQDTINFNLGKATMLTQTEDVVIYNDPAELAEAAGGDTGERLRQLEGSVNRLEGTVNRLEGTISELKGTNTDMARKLDSVIEILSGFSTVPVSIEPETPQQQDDSNIQQDEIPSLPSAVVEAGALHPETLMPLTEEAATMYMPQCIMSPELSELVFSATTQHEPDAMNTDSEIHYANTTPKSRQPLQALQTHSNTHATTVQTPPSMVIEDQYDSSLSGKVNKVVHLKCNDGFVEISCSADMAYLAPCQEVRIKSNIINLAINVARKKAVKNFGWVLCQMIFLGEELLNTNYFGNKANKIPLSPRRRHAIEHAVQDHYGNDWVSLKESITSINTGLRNMTYKKK